MPLDTLTKDIFYESKKIEQCRGYFLLHCLRKCASTHQQTIKTQHSSFLFLVVLFVVQSRVLSDTNNNKC
jgi:hypothetical protein